MATHFQSVEMDCKEDSSNLNPMLTGVGTGGNHLTLQLKNYGGIGKPCFPMLLW